MKKLLFFLCVNLLLLAGAGCEKVIEFTGEETEPRLTLSSQAEAGERLDIYIASSVFFLSDSEGGKAFVKGLDPDQGQVRCYVNGATTSRILVFIPKENSSNLHYRTVDYVPAPGDHIRLEAEFPGFDPVWAETDVPLEPAFELISATYLPSYELELTLAVTDDASYDKYYFLQPVNQTWEPSLEQLVTWPLRFSSKDIIFRDMGGTGALDAFEDETGNFFSDDLIKGQRHVFVITVPYTPKKDPTVSLLIHAAAVDESLYWYGKSFALMRAGDWTGFFSEGVTLYSNVHGGYGVFCAAASRWLEVEW
ncbi:MAG: DUF4249 domain-containing protein [Bacteroidales bacterium]|nr:DUF4249 domain-containing protein [Bacteroidales bacterium]